MLVLGRFTGESFNIYLEDDSIITIKLLDIQPLPTGYVAKIGIDAPKKLSIVRTELLRNTKPQLNQLES